MIGFVTKVSATSFGIALVTSTRLAN